MTRDRGATLIELMTALAIIGLTAAGAYQLLAGHLHHLARREAAVERRQEGRAALALLARELRLAGFPTRPDPVCHAMAGGVEVEPAAIRFLANLHGVATTLAAPASPGDTALVVPDDRRILAGGLTVSPGSVFSARDVIYLHDLAGDQAECHRLDRPGASGRIALAAADPVRRAFPAGSRIEVINLVRYAYAPAARQLTRSVDGASQAVADSVAAAGFSRQGRLVGAVITLAPPDVAMAGLVDVQVAMRNSPETEHE
ncbi:MAG: prepilin-type N-terminal cleavage/methylation domain-containing protein [Nitrospirota bacterium]